jgi:exopolysaccharide production protein ExoZ
LPFPQNTSYPIPLLSTYGWIAVNFFFAISGFVICLVASKANFAPTSFIIRRAFRLYPLWIATALIYLYLTRYVGRGPQQTAPFFWYSLTLLPTDGYPFYDIGWSLQHEFAFYVLAAMLVPWGGVRVLAFALIVGVCLDHAFELPWYLHQYFKYYPDFLAGVAVFATYRLWPAWGALPPLALSAATFTLLSFFAGAPANYFPVAVYFALIAFLNLRAASTTALGRFGMLLGDASYSIYLIHPLVLTYVYTYLHEPLPSIWWQEPLRYGSLLAVVAISIVSWKKFEQPMISAGSRFVKRLEISGLPEGLFRTH